MSDIASAMSTTVPNADPPKPRRPRKAKTVKTAAPKKKRKAKVAKAAPAKRAPRGAAVQLELHDAIGLAASMHRTDVPVFQSLVEILNAKGKPSRKRLLAALQRVFS
jgi:hypothetical protein